jgi:hypothetical protein
MSWPFSQSSPSIFVKNLTIGENGENRDTHHFRGDDENGENLWNFNIRAKKGRK